MNSNVGMAVWKKDRHKIISVNKTYFSHFQLTLRVLGPIA